MKYIIDLPEEIAKASEEYWKKSTGMVLVPYTEPDRKAIEDEVWNFVDFMIYEMDGEEREECFGKSAYAVCIHESTYQGAKAGYDEWKKQKDEIRVGDEVVYDTERYNHEVKAVVLRPETDDEYAAILTLHNLNRITASKYELRKTGRHFDEVAELLKKMGEG